MTDPLIISPGMLFSHWKILYTPEQCDKWGARIILAQCQCLLIKEIPVKELFSGKRNACQKCKRPSRLTHGHNIRTQVSSTYIAWQNMRRRCQDPNIINWKDYGGRGITVCQRWNDSFEAFLEDMGERPGKEFTMDRRENSLGYNPTNCYWATRLQQARNTRRNHFLEWNGERLTLSEWSERTGILAGTLYMRRVVMQWSIEKTLTVSVKPRK